MSGQSGGLNQYILAKMKAFSLSRQGAPPAPPHASSTGTIPTTSQAQVANVSNPGPSRSGPLTGAPRGLPHSNFAGTKNWTSSPSDASVSISGANPSTTPPKLEGSAAKRMKPGLKLSDAGASNGSNDKPLVEKPASRHSASIPT